MGAELRAHHPPGEQPTAQVERFSCHLKKVNQNHLILIQALPLLELQSISWLRKPSTEHRQLSGIKGVLRTT